MGALGGVVLLLSSLLVLGMFVSHTLLLFYIHSSFTVVTKGAVITVPQYAASIQYYFDLTSNGDSVLFLGDLCIFSYLLSSHLNPLSSLPSSYHSSSSLSLPLFFLCFV